MDANDFEALYHAAGAAVFGVCLRLTGDREWAAELTQAAFVRVWEKRRLLRDREGAVAWVRRVATNLTLNALRDAQRRGRHAGALPEGGVPDPRPANPDARLDLERAIAVLPEGARTVFVLYDIEGYAHEEIADMLGVTAGTVRSQLHRARALLREELA
jgi:RNA polymerase sigma-70 factor (ECF subfamily)